MLGVQVAAATPFDGGRTTCSQHCNNQDIQVGHAWEAVLNRLQSRLNDRSLCKMLVVSQQARSALKQREKKKRRMLPSLSQTRVHVADLVGQFPHMQLLHHHVDSSCLYLDK